MATKWSVTCDRCGAEYTSGDDMAKVCLGIPDAPANAYFSFRHRESEQKLSVDLCSDCGKLLRKHLESFFPEKMWNVKD